MRNRWPAPAWPHTDNGRDRLLVRVGIVGTSFIRSIPNRLSQRVASTLNSLYRAQRVVNRRQFSVRIDRNDLTGEESVTNQVTFEHAVHDFYTPGLNYSSAGPGKKPEPTSEVFTWVETFTPSIFKHLRLDSAPRNQEHWAVDRERSQGPNHFTKGPGDRFDSSLGAPDRVNDGGRCPSHWRWVAKNWGPESRPGLLN